MDENRNLSTKQKKEVYRSILKLRRQEAFATFPTAALSLRDNALPFLKGTKILAGYYPMGYEINPLPLLEAVKEQGAMLALPFANERGRPLLFRAWDDHAPLDKTSLGFKQPSPTAALVVPDTLLVPLLGFDTHLFRLGYGRGDYDLTIRTLKNSGPLLTLGLAFEAQKVDKIPREDHDEPLDYVVTEKGIFLDNS